jgi:hypothetical protein
MIKNASETKANGPMHSNQAVRGDANLAQICTSDVSSRMPSVRSRLADVLLGPTGSDPCSMRLLSCASTGTEALLRQPMTR